MKKIYLDHVTTTPARTEAVQAMWPYFGEIFGNPGSFHSTGQKAHAAIEAARAKTAQAIGARPAEIVFTSGGTEAINMAIKGIARANKKKGNHIITCAIEHHASLNSCKALTKEGFEVTVLPVDNNGMVSAAEVAEAITDQTILVNIMHANNEVGTIQPIKEIAQITRKKGVYFHTDACQTVGRLPINVEEMGFDLLSLSGHKIYGPKGVGALYIKKGVKWQPLFNGGAQERLRRSGTENVPGIVGLGTALELASAEMATEMPRLASLRDRLAEGLLAKIKRTRLTGHKTNRLPNHISLLIEFIEGESQLLSLDAKGISASTGSACTSGSLEPSHVLLAMGIPHEQAHGSLVLSLGRDNQLEDIDFLLTVFPEIVERLRSISPLDEDVETPIGSTCGSCQTFRTCRT
ncbi:MAG: cysteine desulfurase NifS [Syntrophomonadaceae bacterium]|nr:cysteine desulfurase NifS [Syntrophomonadaceae bacterium]